MNIEIEIEHKKTKLDWLGLMLVVLIMVSTICYGLLK
jgi:hypothetical protein